MGRKDDDIRRFFERQRKGDLTELIGRVVAVDHAAFCCDVEKGEGVNYFDVRLRAVADDKEGGTIAIPRIGSSVLISRIGDGEWYVAMFSEVEKTVIAIDKASFSATKNGFMMSRESSGLKKTLGDLCDAIANLTVTTAVGASGVPINITDFQDIKSDLDNYLE